MTTWLLSDTLGRTFLVLPIFTVCMFAFGAARFTMKRDPSPLIAPTMHAAVVVAVLMAWVIGAPQAAEVITGALGVGLELLWLALVLPAIVAVYLMELWMSERLVRSRSVDSSKMRPLEQLQLISAGLAGGVLGSTSDRPAVAANPMQASEAFDAVMRISRRPLQFLMLSVATATAEELLYRVAMLDGLAESRGHLFAVIVQAIAYAANHLPFGFAAFIGKFVLGVLLGAVVVVSGSVIVALVGHGWFQYLVYRRLRRLGS